MVVAPNEMASSQARTQIISSPYRRSRTKLWLLAAVLLVGLLITSHDLPASPSRVGPGLLVARLQWTAAWLGLHWLALIPEPSAEALVQLDSELQTDRAQEAARWLARSASSQQDRLRWAAEVTKRDPSSMRLLHQAVRDAIATRRCDLLRAAVAIGRTLAAGSPARRNLADEFAHPNALAHWGRTSITAGRQVANTKRLDQAARTVQAMPSATRHASPATRVRSSACIP